MKTPRSIGTQAACALLLAVGATGFFAFTYIDRAPQPTDNAVHPPASSASEPSPVQTQNTHPAEPKPAAKPEVALRLDDSTDLQPSAPAQSAASRADEQIAANGVDAAAAGEFVESDEPMPGLNLEMPEDAAGAALVDHQTRTDADERAAPARPATSNIALNADGEVEVNPEVETFSVFNPEYGLRGFMKQNWINQRVALQGGFGLDDDRLDKTGDDDIRDNLAVGMGLILAF